VPDPRPSLKLTRKSRSASRWFGAGRSQAKGGAVPSPREARQEELPTPVGFPRHPLFARLR
jgi:hypothetical protein